MTRYHPHPFQGKAIVALPFFFLIKEREDKRKAPQRFLSAELFDILRAVTLE